MVGMNYGPDDIDIINEALQLHPDVNDLVAAVKAVTAVAEFPIASRSELEEQLATRRGGGDQEQLPGEVSQLLEAAVSGMPAFYFPIASRRDLVAKLVEFARGSSAGLEPGPREARGSPGVVGLAPVVRHIRPEDVKEGPLGPTESPPRAEPVSSQLDWPAVIRR
jgi:hypothetical protein